MAYNEIEVIAKAHPVFQPRLRSILAGLRSLGWRPKIAELVRFPAEQRVKVEKGYSKTMRSWHVPSTTGLLATGNELWEVHGAAADIVDARYGWGGPAANTEYKFWKDLGCLAKEQGCEWGGDWKRFKDVAHIEMKFIESAPSAPWWFERRVDRGRHRIRNAEDRYLSPMAIQNNIARIASPLGPDKLLLRVFEGHEEISRPFHYEAEVFSEDHGIDFNQLLGKPVSIELVLPGGARRWFHGVVNHCEQGESVHRYARYRLSVVPWLWLLTRKQDCRIFQDKSVLEIVRTLVKELGFDRHFESRVTANYAPREYCVQYRESTFQFISRLLEEEGIYYWFEHGKDAHVMVLGDSPVLHQPVPGFAQVPFRSTTTADGLLDAFDAWRLEAGVETGAVMLNDYNFQQHGKSIQGGLRTRSSIPPGYAHGNLEVFDYPGEYDHESIGNAYARIRLEERHSRRTVSRAEGTARAVTTGCTFHLRDHPRQDQNAGYLVIRSEVRCVAAAYAGEVAGDRTEPSYRVQVEAIPADRQFRPARITPRPVVQGPQTAVVVGPQGQEIYVDDFARVKVQFHWDRYGGRDQNSSCWIRVSQPWAGVGYGGLCIPRVKQEVIVDFLEGDPDRPIINGRVYNADSMPPVSNAGRDGKPGNTAPSAMTQAAMMTSLRSQSTPGGGGNNEITLNDSAGEEGLFIKAQKDEIHNVGNDREDTVGNNETRKVGVDRSREVGNNETVKIGVDRSKEVGSNETETIGGNKSESVGGNKSINVAGNHSEQIGGMMSLTVGMVKTETVALASMETVGAAKALSVGAAYQVSVGGLMNETVGAAKMVQVAMSSLETVGQTSSLKAKKVTITAEDEISIKVGSAQVTMKKNGDITIKGNNIKLNGTKIEQN